MDDSNDDPDDDLQVDLPSDEPPSTDEFDVDSASDALDDAALLVVVARGRTFFLFFGAALLKSYQSRVAVPAASQK